VECLKCGVENPANANFCSGCGTKAGSIVCGHCEADNAPGSSFCIGCGQPLRSDAPKQALRSAHAERRILTVLFCDLVDSTVLVDNLDPELSRTIIRDFQIISKAVIERLGGRISTYLGDGVVALFARHESNAERAINTALQIIREIGQERDSFSQSGQKIQVRCGIATGLAVVGDDMLGQSRVREETAIGLPLNLAARIQGLAERNGVAVSEASYQMTRGLFEFEDIGQHALKGIKEPQQVWRVVRGKSISSRFIAHAAELTPMVDRSETLQTLMDCWKAATRQHAQTVLITGEPGIGKSRVVQEMNDIISLQEEHHHPQYQCSPYHNNTALHPVITRLKTAAGIEEGDGHKLQLEKLEALVKNSSQDVAADMPAFVDLLNLPSGEKWQHAHPDADEKKEWIFSTMLNNMLYLSKSRPVLITIEDVHWIDPTTLDLLNRLIGAIKGHAILLIITAREGYDEALLRQTDITLLELEKLPQEYAHQLLNQVQGQNKLPGKVLDEILERTDGIPLFIEELSKNLMEMELGNVSLLGSDVITLPATVQESLLARLDRLPEAARTIAHLAAVIGRDFSFDLLEKVAEYRDKNLYQDLTPLLKAQMVFQRKAPPNAEFSFKHALFRDVAYETLLKSDLVRIHRRIAEVIEQDYPDMTSNNPELVARHFTEGGDYSKAVSYWLSAGIKASRQFALIEARAHLTQGLQCLDKCPDGDQLDSVRLEYLIALGPVLMALEGSGSEITRKNYSEAVSLCNQLPASAMQFMALWGQWNVSMDYNRDHGLIWADRLQQLAEELDTAELKLQAHHCQWATRFHYANHEDAQNHLNQGLALYQLEAHRHHAGVYGGHDPKVCGLSFLSWVLWFRGQFNQAASESRHSLDFAGKLDHAGSYLHAVELNLSLSLFQRDRDRTRELTDELESICRKLNLPEYAGKLNCCRGIVMSDGGDLKQGIELIRKGLVELDEVGTNEDVPVYTEYLARLLGEAGRSEQGLEHLDELVDSLQKQRLRYWHPELYRRKGKLLLDRGEHQLALSNLLKALKMADRQQALALSLRAALALHLLNEQTGLYPEAGKTLRLVHGKFNPQQSAPELEVVRLVIGESQ
jgi:predicted ATPase/class 3 adenylate cyclase